jgi:hypothetical protein
LPGIRFPEVLTDEDTTVAHSILLPDEALKDVAPGKVA